MHTYVLGLQKEGGDETAEEAVTVTAYTRAKVQHAPEIPDDTVCMPVKYSRVNHSCHIRSRLRQILNSIAQDYFGPDCDPVIQLFDELPPFDSRGMVEVV